VSGVERYRVGGGECVGICEEICRGAVNKRGDGNERKATDGNRGRCGG